MQSLTEGKVSSILVRFSGPFLFAGMVQMGHGLINVFLLSWLASPASVAGAFNGNLLVMTATATFSGLGTAGMILLGQFIGAKQDKNAAKTVGNVIIVQGLIAVICGLILFTLGGLFIRLLNVPAYYLENGLSAASEANSFLRIAAFGALFQVSHNTVNSMLRALGDSLRPMIFITSAFVINIGLDFIFIGALGMGAAGAALATACAQAGGFLMASLYLRYKKFPFAFSKSYIRPDREILRNMFKLGMPISLQMLLNMISFTIVARIINSLGTAEAAANSLVNSVFRIVVMVPFALGQAINPITAQNFGAGRPERALQSTKLAILFSLAIAAPAMLVSSFFPSSVLSLFSPDEDVVRVGAQFLTSFSWDFVLVAFIFNINNFYNGMGITTFVAAHELTAALLIRVPLTWLLSSIEGATLFYVGMGAPAASAISLIMLLIYYRVKLSGGKLKTLNMTGA